MVPQPTLNEDKLDRVATYSVGSTETMSEAVISAFYAANIDVSEKPTQLFDWINSDVFGDIRWNPPPPVYLSKRIWGRRVVITAEEIRIYDSMNLNSPG
jgi:hypothetical protein